MDLLVKHSSRQPQLPSQGQSQTNAGVVEKKTAPTGEKHSKPTQHRLSPSHSLLCSIGHPPWKHEEYFSAWRTFKLLYKNRPFPDNPWGMQMVELFGMFSLFIFISLSLSIVSLSCMSLNLSEIALWFGIRKIQPKFVIESGVWQGQSTWFVRQAVPDATIICLDPSPVTGMYIDPKATVCIFFLLPHSLSLITVNLRIVFVRE